MIKRYIFVIFLFFGLSLFFQVTSTGQVINKDSALCHLDTLVEKYEMEGLNFYEVAKYDSAIKRFNKASNLLDSLLKIKKRRSDFIANIVTECNIGICYSKIKDFYKTFKYLPSGNFIEPITWMELNPKYDSYNEKITIETSKLLAFIQNTYGDCYLNKGDIYAALNWYGPAKGNLKEIKFPNSGILTYRYAIRSYSYYSVNITLGDFYKTIGDTSHANLYYRKSIGK